MRYGPDHKETARAKILHAVGRGFRQQGFAGIGVDGLAKEAGVTSGAFYGHFASKAEAFQAAAVAGLAELREAVSQLQATAGREWLAQFATFYMGFKRTCDLKESCALQSLTPEVARAGKETKVAFEEEMSRLVETIATGLSTGGLAARRKTAWAILALLSGGVTLARATCDAKTGDNIERAVIAAVLAIAKNS